MTKRQDNWTEKEDKLLIKTVIGNIKNGKTQVEAFASVSKEISRTTAACAYRWNSVVRKKHEKDVEKAKDFRNCKSTKPAPSERDNDSGVSFSEVLNYLKNLHEHIGDGVEAFAHKERLEGLEKQLSDYKDKLQQSRKENEELRGMLVSVRQALSN